MSDLHPIAKRIYNVSPDPVRLTLDDGTESVFRLSSAEFFQTEFRGEATREGDDAAYRLTTTEDESAVIVGRQAPREEGWSFVGEVVAAERA